jgi:hypothetical protein
MGVGFSSCFIYRTSENACGTVQVEEAAREFVAAVLKHGHGEGGRSKVQRRRCQWLISIVLVVHVYIDVQGVVVRVTHGEGDCRV